MTRQTAASGRALGTALLAVVAGAAAIAFLAWRVADTGADRAALAAIARSGARVDYGAESGRLDLDFSAPAARDDGLDAIAGFSSLESLVLRGGAILDASLARLGVLRDRRGFHSLTLDRTGVTGPGLASLADFPIRSLVLRENPIPPEALERLGALRSLRHLTLYDDGLSDSDLAHLEGLTRLESLALFLPRATNEGVARLARSLPRCEVRSHRE